MSHTKKRTRYELSTTQWRKIEGFLPGRPGSVGVTAKDNRNFVNGVLWVLRSGAHWKDRPPRYGDWKSANKRFTRWARDGTWERILKVLPGIVDPLRFLALVVFNVHPVL